MADLRFTVVNPDEFDPRVWETAYITGIEGIPWQCHHQLSDGQFIIGREIDESGKLNIVWPTSSLGNVCLSTTSLRLSEEHYSLAVEVARGTVYRLKTQTAEWQRVGIRLPNEFFTLAEDSLSELLHALTVQDESAKQKHAQKSIDLSLQAAVELCNTFSLQALEARKNNEGRLATLLGGQLQSDSSVERVKEVLTTAFNFIGISADFGAVESTSGKSAFEAYDKQIEWACEAGLKVCLGPLVDFRDGQLPDWMMLLDDGFESVLQSACEHVRKTVERYRGKVHLWNCATGLNVPTKLRWSDEQTLRMAVSLIETVRRADDRTPVVLTIDQPWSEYLRNDANGISPLHFADALIRADLGLSGLAMEINFDQWPGGTLPRDPIEVNRLIDRWSMLGLPLMVTLSGPAEPIADSQEPTLDRRVTGWKMADANGQVGLDAVVRLLVSKPSVHAVIWNNLTDNVANTIGSGLWTANGKAKPILASLAKLRKSCLH